MPGLLRRRLIRVLPAAVLACSLGGVIAPACAEAAAAGVAAQGTAAQGVAAQGTEQPVQLSAKPVGQSGQFFDLTLAAGQSRRLQVALGNHGKRPIVVRTYVSDVYTIINGGFGAALRGAATTGTARWVDYPPGTPTLQPGRAAIRSFIVSVPKGTPAGEYITSVVLENDVPIKGDGAVALDQIVRQAVAVAVRVPGPLRPGLAIGAVSHTVVADRSAVAIDVRNTGNARLKPIATIVIHDDAGAVVSRAVVPMDSFYAHTDTQVEITLARQLLPGQYTADLALQDNGRPASATARGLPFTVMAPVKAVDHAGSLGAQVIDVLQPVRSALPSWALLDIGVGISLVALVAVLLIVRARRRRRRAQARALHSRSPRAVAEATARAALASEGRFVSSPVGRSWPTRTPTLTPTRTPTRTPTLTPTLTPTRTPTLTPTLTPTRTPTSPRPLPPPRRRTHAGRPHARAVGSHRR